MADERDATDDTDEPQRQALAQSARVQAALIAALDAAGAWCEPLVMAHALAIMLRGSLVGVVKLAPNRIPWALTLLDQVRGHVADVAVTVAPGETTH